MTGKYKMVWLYNSEELDLDGQTTCEVFDFSINTWRHVIGSTHCVRTAPPVHLDGSLHWLTLQCNGETKIVYFDLHTEVFQVTSEIPIAHADPDRTVMCSLNNRLCVSERKDNSQDIWSLNSHKVWEKTYTMNLSFACRDEAGVPMIPITILSKTELLFLYPFRKTISLLIQDTTRKGHNTHINAFDLDQAVSYIPSLIFI